MTTHRIHISDWDCLNSAARCSCLTWSRIGSTTELYRWHQGHVDEARSGQTSMFEVSA